MPQLTPITISATVAIDDVMSQLIVCSVHECNRGCYLLCWIESLVTRVPRPSVIGMTTTHSALAQPQKGTCVIMYVLKVKYGCIHN